MDFCRNMSVSGGMPSECQQEQVLSPPCSKLGGGLTGSLDDLFSGQNTEVDVSLEWLSIFVEDCFSSTGHCLPAAAAAAATNIEKKTSTSTPKHLQLQKPQEKHKYPTTTTPSLQKFVFPSKARSKRRRPTTTTTTVNNNRAKSSWVHQLNPQSHHHSSDLQLTSSDPPLLQQAYWLADSELILPPKKEDNCNLLLLPVPVPVPVPVGDDETNVEIHQVVNKVEEEKEMVMGSSLEGGGVVGQARRCTHCLSQRTPQWRAGPLGPKTLCNACGVRYKSGRLLPEYRPAKSPTFVSYLHSNSHKKVLEMRMGALSPTSPHH